MTQTRKGPPVEQQPERRDIWRRAYERMWTTAAAQTARAEKAEAANYDIKTLSETMRAYGGSACRRFATADPAPRRCSQCGCDVFQHLARGWADQLAGLLGEKVEP